jgi:D-alanine-D-alanine ligase
MRNLAVLCGGLSSEYEISLRSAQTIIQNFPKDYLCHRIILDHQGWWYDSPSHGIQVDKNDFTALVAGEKINFDLVLIYIHGFPGEDGKLQAYFDMLQIPYLNSGALASELSFDKWYCNQFIKHFGIPVAESFLFNSPHEHPKEMVVNTLGLPLFLKPCDSGSSFGVSRVNEISDYDKAMEYAFSEGDTVVAERFLNGREVTCGAYKTVDGIVTLPPTEIVSEGEFFDFAAKYEGKSQEITPARISLEETKLVQQYTEKIYRILRLKSLARIDFIIENGVPHLVEVNTTPGFSPASIVPQQLACAGISITDCFEQILHCEFGHFYRGAE